MSSTSRGQFVSTVRANAPLCRDHFRLELEVDGFPSSEPGQFVQIACRDMAADFDPDHDAAWDAGESFDVSGTELMAPLAMLRRPFSLAGRRNLAGGRVELDIIHRVVGTGTDWLARLKQNDRVYLLGPLGNRFQLPPAGATAILIGGGVGIPPMIYLAEKLRGRPAVAFSGALTKDLLPLTITDKTPPPTTDRIEPLLNIDEFVRDGIPALITTDDGSYGYRGFVTQALEGYLDAHRGQSHIIYTCGPEPMMKRVAQIALARNIPCQIAVERAMACGMGTCQSCCIRVKKSDPQKPPLPGRDWCYRLACTDGPVFQAADLLW